MGMDMIDRIKQLMEAQHMTQQTFSDFIGISSASLSSIFNGRTKPTLNTIEAIRSKFTKISLEWLMYGVGPMFKDEVKSAPSDNDGGTRHQESAMEGQIDFGGMPSAPSHPSYGTDSAYVPQSGTAHASKMDVKYVDKPQRQITEIRIFFDDQTWQSFVPKK